MVFILLFMNQLPFIRVGRWILNANRISMLEESGTGKRRSLVVTFSDDPNLEAVILYGKEADTLLAALKEHIITPNLDAKTQNDTASPELANSSN